MVYCLKILNLFSVVTDVTFFLQIKLMLFLIPNLIFKTRIYSFWNNSCIKACMHFFYLLSFKISCQDASRWKL